MSQAPQSHQTFIVQAPESNGLGTAGFVVSLIGIVTCGLLSPIGLGLSLIAFLKPPRGMAYAGAILGAIGTLGLIAMITLFAAGLIGFGEALDDTSKQIQKDAMRIVEEEKQRKQNEQRPAAGIATMDGYNKITTGMTYDDVIAIVGQPFEEVSRVTIDEHESVVYNWHGEKLISTMTVSFQDGKVIAKAQFGLK